MRKSLSRVLLLTSQRDCRFFFYYLLQRTRFYSKCSSCKPECQVCPRTHARHSPRSPKPQVSVIMFPPPPHPPPRLPAAHFSSNRVLPNWILLLTHVIGGDQKPRLGSRCHGRWKQVFQLLQVKVRLLKSKFSGYIRLYSKALAARILVAER